jgi:hypothetical protein
MPKPFAVVFSGVPGSSKTIISNYLSVKFLLPVFNNDQLRFEVKEDMRADNINRSDVLAEYERRYKDRFEELLATGHPMLLDGSIDRRWPQTRRQLQQFGYRWYLIEMALSEAFLRKFFIDTGRPKFLDQLPRYIEDHEKFIKEYGGEIDLRIGDDDFSRRLGMAQNGVSEFIKLLEAQAKK